MCTVVAVCVIYGALMSRPPLLVISPPPASAIHTDAPVLIIYNLMFNYVSCYTLNVKI